MKILLLAPHPFYQERGTPIAVDFLARALSERGEQVDLLVFNEGEAREYHNIQLHRTFSWPKIEGVKPGFSLKKLYLDLWFFFKFIKLMLSNRYDVVHAIEESGFMAMLLCPLFKVPYILDMDSLMATQIIDKFPLSQFLKIPLRFIESLPMRFAKAVVPVCDALADEVRLYRQDNIFILKDISLIKAEDNKAGEDLRQTLHITNDIVMYIGNLEVYQGIDLLLHSFQLACQQGSDATLLIIGGDDADINKYQMLSKNLGLDGKVKLLGKRPVADMSALMAQADILVSPRIQGLNTPMKVYSYLDSGTAVLATDLPTHTQVMSHKIAALAAPEVKDFATAMKDLLMDKDKRVQLAKEARVYIQQEHSYAAFCRQLDAIYDLFDTSLKEAEQDADSRRTI